MFTGVSGWGKSSPAFGTIAAESQRLINGGAGVTCLVPTCTSCGHENSDAARICEACGAVLGAASGEHRKVVTVLFCDVA